MTGAGRRNGKGADAFGNRIMVQIDQYEKDRIELQATDGAGCDRGNPLTAEPGAQRDAGMRDETLPRGNRTGRGETSGFVG